jgi:tRNA U34 5-carboxymethylaminomethyl modifying enzyme MnmG/GidA
MCLCSMGSWCTLEWLGYPYALIIGNAINSRGRICVKSWYLTTKIPSALLVAVGWLQQTRYPRFRRGTFDYGVTTSPNERGRVRVWRFMRMHVSIPMLPKCTCYATHAQSHILVQITRFEQDRKEQVWVEESIRFLAGTRIHGVRILIDHNWA